MSASPTKHCATILSRFVDFDPPSHAARYRPGHRTVWLRLRILVEARFNATTCWREPDRLQQQASAVAGDCHLHKAVGKKSRAHPAMTQVNMLMSAKQSTEATSTSLPSSSASVWRSPFPPAHGDDRRRRLLPGVLPSVRLHRALAGPQRRPLFQWSSSGTGCHRLSAQAISA